MSLPIFRAYVRELGKTVCLTFVSLAFLFSFIDRPLKQVPAWSPLAPISGAARPVKLLGPREFSYNVYGKGFFEGGPKVRGDVRVDQYRWSEKGPPFRPSIHLKGIPVSDFEGRRKSSGSGRGWKSLALPLGTEGFTLIELVMVILLLAVLAAVAIPNFQDFRSDARNSATKGALGGVRSAIAIARAAIALKEDVGVPIYPTAIELQANTYAGSHPILNALSPVNKRLMDAAVGMPVNPWAWTTLTVAQQSSVWDCTALAKNLIRSAAEQDFGWCYNTTSGDFWPNSDRNGQVSPNTENKF